MAMNKLEKRDRRRAGRIAVRVECRERPQPGAAALAREGVWILVSGAIMVMAR